MFRFTLASLTPAILIMLACVFGGTLPVLAFGYVAFCVAILGLLGRSRNGQPGHPTNEGAADALLITLSLAHVLILGATLYAAPSFGLFPAVCLILSTSLFLGQVSHPNAHELIHHRNKGMRRLGVFIYSTMLFGHHASAHPLIHHVHVATELDPNSARMGEGFYRFVLRASYGSFRAGLAAETRRRRGHDGLHPYIVYLLIGGLSVATAAGLQGIYGVLTLVAICLYAQMQIYLADYVQQYGLIRAAKNGKPEPVGLQHSWNAPNWYSSAMMLNAPRHSDHHLNPAKRYPELNLTTKIPTLPRSLPVMAVIAMVPPLWKEIMNPRVHTVRDTQE
ncbi:MAG: alkane 1-monooxygenase [Paracoccaceae bacterium]